MKKILSVALASVLLIAVPGVAKADGNNGREWENPQKAISQKNEDLNKPNIQIYTADDDGNNGRDWE